MNFGLSDSELSFLIEAVVLPLEKHGAKIWCYGSRARGDHSRFSDVDLMVETNKDLSGIIGEIQETLENSNFLYLVDLVLLSQFAESYKSGYESDKLIFTK